MIDSFQIFSLTPYDNFDKGVRIQYPSNWEKEEDEQDPRFARFFAPIESRYDTFDEQVLLQTSNLPDPNMNISEALEYYIGIQSSFPEFSLTNKMTNLTIAGDRPAFGMNYTYYSPNFMTTLNAMIIGTIADNKIYTIMYLAEPSKFDVYLPIAKQMIDSFQTFSLIPYDNFNKGVRIQYPSNWEKVEDKLGTYFARFYAPIENISDTFDEQVLLQTFDLPDPNMDISTTIDYIINIQSSLPKFSLTNKITNLTIAQDRPAFGMNYTYYDSNWKTTLNAMEVATIADNKIYLIRYLAEPSKFDVYLPIAKQMIDSYKFFILEFFEDVPNGLQIFYPSTWSKEKLANGITFYNAENLFPKDNLTIVSYNSTDSIKSINESKWKTYKSLTNFKVIKKTNTTIFSNFDNSNVADQLIYKYNDKRNNSIIATDIFTKFNHREYHITFSTLENRYTSSIPQSVNDLISYFRIIESFDFDLEKSKQLFGLNIKFPNNWLVETSNSTFFSIYPNLTTDSPISNLTHFSIQIRNIGTQSYDSIVEDVLERFNYLGNVSIEESQIIPLKNNPAYRLVINTENENNSLIDPTKTILIINKIGSKLYLFELTTEQKRFGSYLPLMNKLMDELDINEKKVISNKRSGIVLEGRPISLDINHITNKIYVALSESKSILVYDGNNDTLIDTISLDVQPNTLFVNSDQNKIYVSNKENDYIYVIDGKHKEISKIKFGSPLTKDIDHDHTEYYELGSILFIAATDNPHITILDERTNKTLGFLNISSTPLQVEVDPIKNKAYVTSDDRSLDIFKYNTDRIKQNITINKIRDLSVGSFPNHLTLDKENNKLYIANENENSISIIDTLSDVEIKPRISISHFPQSIEISQKNKGMYISHGWNNSILLVNITNSFQVPEIIAEIDSIPFDISLNPTTNLLYTANYDAKSLSIINTTINKEVSGVIFKVYPHNSGKIICNKTEMPLNKFIRVDADAKCVALSNSGNIFTDWSNYNEMDSAKYLTLDSLYHYLLSLIGNSLGFEPHQKNLLLNGYGIYIANFLTPIGVINQISPFLSIGALFVVTAMSLIGSRRSAVSLSNNKSSTLSREDIIMTDATVIIGVLVFLSLSGSNGSEQSQINIITAGIVFPFALSAMSSTIGNNVLGGRLMIAGFINLMISMILVSILLL
jgi:DNA-binding beta-propeller fold protein YncE